jgi:bifunctional enzyme CysN/CysC
MSTMANRHWSDGCCTRPAACLTRCRPNATGHHHRYHADPLPHRSRDVVLIDAPGHAEFLRNMITGASQADGAVLIIDALEGVRDQTRRHGYLLHLLGIRQVAVVVNKMDRVDFSADRFKEISDEISAHLITLGVTPSAVIPISARDGDGVA